MELKHAYDHFITSRSGKLKPSTLRTYKGYWKTYFRESIGGRDLSTISKTCVESALHEAPRVGFNRALVFLSMVFTYAEVNLEIKGLSNPTRGIERNKENPRKRFLRSDEWERFAQGLRELDEGNPDEAAFSLFIRMILFTGLRKSEAEQSLIENIDFKRSCILIQDAKTGDREVPLPEQLKALLEPLKGQKGFIFPAKKANKGMNYAYRWGKFRKMHGLEDLSRHDLRRTFGVTALNNDLTLEETAGLLGHSSVQTTQKVYAWLSTSSKRKAANKLSATLERNLAS